MARFWVGGTGTWDASTTTHWSTTTGGAGGASAPTSADDVFIDGNSGVGTITTTSPSNTAVCRNLDFTGYTGTFSAPIGSQLLINPTAGGTIKFASGMTVTSPSQFAVSSPSGTNSNLTTNGIGNGVWNFTGSSTGGVTVVDAFTANQITLTIGTLNTNGQTCTWGIFALGSGTKTLTLGASAVTITGTSAGAWDTRTNNTNFTFNANTSSITCNGVGMSFRGGGLTYNSVTMSPGASAQTFGDNNTFTNLIFAGSAVKTNAINLSAGNTQTVTGTFTVSGNSATNRFLVATTTLGTSATINAAAVSLTNVDFMDVAATGAAAPFTGTSLGDCLGNTGITFTTPSTQTWSGTSGGNWSTNAWTSRVPLPQDTVVFSSAFSASQTVVADMPRLGKDISWIGSSGSPIWNFSISCIIYGSVNLTGVGSVSTAVVTTFLSGRSSQTITTNGKTFTIYVQINGPGGTYTLQDNLTINNLVVSNSATFTANNFNLSMANFQITTGTVNMGTGTWSLTSVSALSIWNASAVGPIINASTSTIIITNSSSNPRTFAGGGASYNTLQINGAAGAAAVTISGANTFNTFIAQANAAVAFASSVTQTFNQRFIAIGTSGNLVTITSSSGGTAATLAKVGGQVSMDYVSVQDITGSTATTWYAGTHSTNVSGNTNINFSFATTTKTISTTGGNWSATTAWMEGAVPGAGDDVVGYAGSGALTIDAASSCRSIDLTSYTSTLTHNAFTLTIGSSTANGTTALQFPSSGWTYTLANVATSAIALTSTVASTTQTVDFGAKTTGNVTFNAATTSGYQLVNNGFTCGATATVTLTQGTLNTNGMTCSWGLFSSSNSNTRTMTLGASSLTLTGSVTTTWDMSTTTNLTLNAGTSTITLSTAGNCSLNAPNQTFYNVSMSSSSSSAVGFAGRSGQTFHNLTITGNASKSSLFTPGTITVTNALTVIGNSTTNRLFWGSSVGAGTANTITLTGATATVSNVDFQDITVAGITLTGTSLGDAQGNSGITFDTPVAQTWSGNTTGNWSTAANWTSRVPLPQDGVSIPGLTSGTVTSDMPRLGGSIDFTGSTGGTLTFSTTGTSFGSLNFNSGLAITGNANAQLTLSGRSSYTITSNGAIFPGGSNGVLITAPGGTYTLQDNAPWVSNFSLIAGSFNTNNFNLTCNLMTVTGTLTRALTLGTSTITMVRSSAGSIFQATASGLTLSAASSTFVYAQTSVNAHSFDGAGLTYGNLQITGGSGTSFAITGANTFTGTVTASPDTVLTWPSSTTNTIGSLSATGQNFGYNYFPSVASNFASTPNSADLQLTGDFDFRVLVDLDSYRPTTFAALITKWDASIPNRSYSFVLNTTGTLAVSLTSDNTTSIGSTSSVSVSATPGTPIWLRATRATSTVTFYTSPDGTTWNQLGSTGTNSTTIITGTAALVVGGFGGNGSNPLGGKLYYAEVRSSVNGTIIANPDFRTKTFGANSFADTAGTPKTWAITGTQAQAGDGRVLINSSTAGVAATLSSTGRIALDYVTVQDNTASGNTPFYAGVHGVLISGDTNWLAANAPGGSPNLLLMGVG